MMNNKTYLLSLALACSLVAAPAMAQSGKDGKDGSKITGSVVVGAQTGNGIDDSSKLQQYETVPTGLFLDKVNLSWTGARDYFVDFDGTKLGLADQYANFQGGKKGAWSLTLLKNDNQRWFSNVAETVYANPSPGVFTLSDGMRQSLQKIWYPYTTGGETAAPANSADNRFWSLRDYMNGAQPVDLRYYRKTGLVGFDVTALQDWTFKMSYQRETRNGTQPYSITHGPGIGEIANNIDYTTQDTRAEVEWVKKRAFFNLAFTHSDFNDGVLYTTLDNPVRFSNVDYFWTAGAVNSTSTNATSRIWNAPSNASNAFDYTFGFQMPHHHKVTFTGSYNQMTNDQTLIEQATNPYLNLATTSADYGKFTLKPEYASFNGKLAQTLYNLNFSGEPTTKFGYSFFYRKFDLADHTPTYTFHSTVNSDGGAAYSATGITSSEDARAYTSSQFKAEAHFALGHGAKLGINGGQLKMDYEDRNWQVVKDNSMGVTFDANARWAMFHAGFSKVNRTPSSPDADEAAEGTTGGRLDAGAEMKDVAKQDSTLYNVALTFTPADKVALTISAQGMNAKLPETTIGLKKNSMNNVGFDAVFSLTPEFRLNAGYIYEKIHMDSNFWYSANGTVTTPNATNVEDKYWNTINDTVNTYTVGLRWDIKPGKVDLTSNYDYSKGKSLSGFSVAAGGVMGGDLYYPTNTTTVNFPAIQMLNYPQVYNATTIWKTWLNYHVEKNVTLSLLYWRQKFDQADWAYDGLSPYMLPGSSLYATTPGAVSTLYPQVDPSANRAIFLGATVPNYNANIFRAALTFSF